MENSSFKTAQNAIVKRTLSLEEFIINYITSSNIKLANFKAIATSPNRCKIRKIVS